MSADPRPVLTPAEYLDRERLATFKSEYFRGETFAVAGASREHNLIVSNLVREIGVSLKGRPCEVNPSDMRVMVSVTGLYTYPDVTIVCGEREFDDRELDTLLNPTVLFEVLSATTEAYDRGTKASHYRKLASLKEYVLIAQDRPSVERYLRQPDGSWLLREVTDINGNVSLDALGVSLPMAEIYRRIEFEEHPTTMNGPR
ncbi:MAG: Uma2 family endonuclease [Planctomycetota bacterium]|nr:Uma2 family endonuclease [Planctomycetota bacterium]